MSVTLRILLIIAGIVSYLYVIRKIRKSQMKIESAMYWVFLAGIILLISIFPQIVIWLAEVVGVESPVNLLYLLMIFLVLWKLFALTVKNSQLESKINVLTEEFAICQMKSEEKERKEKQENEEKL